MTAIDITRAAPGRELRHREIATAPAAPAARLAHPAFRPVIRTRRLILRPLAGTDVADMVAAVGDFEVSRMLATAPHPYGEGDARAAISSADATAVGRRGIVFAITRDA